MSFDKPLVSVIVPCYNHEEFVGACIKSVSEQTYENIELIVLDDGSTDSSLAVLNELANSYDFLLDSHPNMGLTATLNKGIGLAGGKFISIIASDDMMTPSRIEKQVAYLESQQEVAVCGGSMLAIDRNGDVTGKQKVVEESVLDFEDMFLGNKNGPAAPTAMIRKSVLDSVGGYDSNIGIEDLYMWLKITSSGYKIGLISDQLAYYRQHGQNIHNNYSWLVDNVEKIYSEYAHHPSYFDVLQSFRMSMFVKTADRDKSLSLSLLSKAAWWRYPQKTAKGLSRLLFKW